MAIERRWFCFFLTQVVLAASYIMRLKQYVPPKACTLSLCVSLESGSRQKKKYKQISSLQICFSTPIPLGHNASELKTLTGDDISQ